MDLFSARFISNGVGINLDDGQPYGLEKEDGLFMAAIQRLTERAAQQHGETDYGFLLDPRIINLVVGIQFSSPTEFWQYRDALMSRLAPYNAPSLEITRLPAGDARRIDLYVTGALTAPSDTREGTWQSVGLTLRAPDPSFYDPTAVDVNFGISGGGTGTPVPTPVPTPIGASTIDQTIGVVYTGSWYSFPTIRITGPITNPVIENETTGEKLDFTGVTINNGDYYDIDTRYGRKSIVDSSGNNKIGDLTDDSDLGTFHLEPDGAIAPGGSNAFRVTGSSVSAVTAVEMTYFNRYLGI